MITFPNDLSQAQAQAAAATGEVRAGATDFTERRHLGLASTDIVDLRDVTEARTIAAASSGGLRLGALVTIAELARDATVRRDYPGLAEAAGGLATPQIRAVGTLGGNLLQRTRCWYYRAPEATCLKRGGARCGAREGDHHYHACFDLGPCVSVHPSTLGMALLAYGAEVELVGADARSVAALLGDGRDPRRDHALPEGALLSAVVLPPPQRGEKSACVRTIARARAEWPLVEAVARLGVVDGRIAWASVAVGGVAPVPLALPAVERALVGAAPTPAALTKAAALATDGAAPLPMTGYKLALLEGTVQDALERALERTPTGGA
jgi:xanthine dehydrogenase YagS FAD-binding subunit